MTENAAGASVDTSAARAFEEYLVPTIFGPWSRALVDLAAPKPGERLLDVGCGTGAAARYAVEFLGPDDAVAAIDIDARMIAFARTLDPPGAIDWHVGDVMRMPFADGAFDIVVGNQVLQFLADRAGALAETRRVLAEGGRAVLNVYCRMELCPGHCAVANALRRHDVDPAGILNPYAFGDPVALGDVIAAAGFRDVAVLRRSMEARFASVEAFVEALAAGGPSAHHALEQLDAEGLRRVIADVADELAGYVDADGLRIVTASNVALARR